MIAPSCLLEFVPIVGDVGCTSSVSSSVASLGGSIGTRMAEIRSTTEHGLLVSEVFFGLVCRRRKSREFQRAPISCYRSVRDVSAVCTPSSCYLQAMHPSASTRHRIWKDEEACVEAALEQD